jgi:hypothetical protein
MRIKHFTRDKQSHDLTGTFKDGIDAAIAQKSFEGNRRFAAAF